MIVVGSDTSAVNLTYLIWSVLRPRNQEVRERLMAEIENVPVDATVTELGTLKYLKGLVYEALRLYGAVSATLPRPGGVELGEYFIPEETTVSAQSYTMCQQEDIY